MRRLYFDHNATCPLLPVAREALLTCLDSGLLGNPSSAHEEGRRAREVIEQAREQLAGVLDCGRDEIVFTSGGTEANAMALRAATPDAPVLVSPLEHPSLLVPVRCRPASGLLPLDRAGRVDTGRFRRCLEAGPALVSVGLVNHETGILQDVAALAALAHQAGVLAHTDASQALGKIPASFRSLGVDLMTLSAHKLGGPVGIGALIVRNGVDLRPILLGGPQEGGHRAGTEPCALAAAFAAVAAESARLLVERARLYRGWTRRLLTVIRALEPELQLNSAEQEDAGSPTTLNVSFPGRPASSLVHRLDLEGVSASHGSACGSGALEPSPVLLALGCSEQRARSSLRLSVGPMNTPADVEAFAPRLTRVLHAVAPRQLT